MGLDAVELILRAEEEFSITIADEEAEAAVTVGDLYNTILSKLDTINACVTSKAFYLTRRALVEALELPRRSIHPATRLSPLLPDNTRRAKWHEIRTRIGLETPPLRIPGTLKQLLFMRAFFGATVLMAALCIAALWLGSPPLTTFVVSAVVWVALSTASISLVERVSASRLAVELPADTAGELARVILSLNQNHFGPPEPTTKPSNEDVWNRLVDIICDQLQVRRDEVVPNARFVDDLGVA